MKRVISVRYKKKRRAKIYLRISAVLFLLFGAILLIDYNMRPTIIAYSQYTARALAVGVINTAVIDEMQADKAEYAHLADVQYGPDGAVISVAADAVRINELKSRLIRVIQDEVYDIKEQNFSIPLGTLIGWNFLSGRGPRIPFRVIPTSSVTADIASELTESGINQTLHSILLTVEVKVSAIIPGYSSSVSVENEICIAQTVIVGKVPDSYTVVNGDTQDTVGKINDYS